MMKIFQAKDVEDYYNGDKIRSLGADYNLIYGEKSNGKSFDVKKDDVMHFLQTGGQTVLVRRYETEITKAKLELYFADTAKHLPEWTDEFNTIYIYNSQIYLAKRIDGKMTNSTRFGYALALNLAQSYSGNAFPDVDRIILEEFISLNGQYLPNELFLFNHIISTVARKRNIRVDMLANSISRLSPYWREYGVEEIINQQEQGTIALIERETDNGFQRVAVEYCANVKQVSRMFAGKRSEMILKGKWLTKEMPKLPFDYFAANILYKFVVQYNTALFLVEYLSFNGQYCLYVTPKTTAIKKNTRVISNYSSANPLYSYGFRPLNAKERLIFDMLKNGKTFYCDNLTGTEFEESLKNLSKCAIF